MPETKVYSDLRVIEELKAARLTVYGEYTLPQTDGTAGYILATDGAGNVQFVDAQTLAVTQDNFIDTPSITWTQVGNDIQGDVSLAPFTTDDLSQGVTNLYYSDERVDDRVSSLIQDGTGISWSYNDGLGTLTPTISLSSFTTDDLAEGATNRYYSNELVDDRVATLLLPAVVNASPSPTNPIVWQYNDGPGTLLPKVSLDPFNTDDLAEGSTNLYYSNERVDDRVASLIQNGPGITWSYNDGLGTLTPTVTPVPIGVQCNDIAVGSRGNIDFCEGSNIGLSMTDDSINDRVVVTINYTGGDPVIQEAGGAFSSYRIDSCNVASGDYSAATGGMCNAAETNYSTISGGYCNRVASLYSTIGGGHCNMITSSLTPSSTIGGGCNNTICDRNCASTISGGQGNVIYCNSTIDRAVTIGGGCNNRATGLGSTISGGRGNEATCRSTISGGDTNLATGSWSSIIGGICNTAGCNTVGCVSASGGGSVAAGVGANGAGATIVIGSDNVLFSGTINRCNNGQFSTVTGGFQNRTPGLLSTVSGGYINVASGVGSAILGGCNNVASGQASSILGGTGNTVSHACSFAAGLNITSVADCTLHVNRIYIGNLPTADPGIPGMLYRTGGDVKISL